VLETKLVVDSCIHLPSQWFKLNVVPGAFLDQPDKPMSLKISKSLTTAPDVKVRARHIVPGTIQKQDKEHRNFQWLGWWSGAISQVPRHRDVLTGPMSGCWVVVYRRNGIEYVAHIGKNKDNKAHSEAVVAGWNNYARAHPDSIICGFNPRRHWAIKTPARNERTDRIVPQCLALVTREPTPKLWSIFTYRQEVDSNLLRIAAIEEVESSSREQLQNTD
jgi:hypothetical protein